MRGLGFEYNDIWVLRFGFCGMVDPNSEKACNRPCFHAEPPRIPEVKTAHCASCFPFVALRRGLGEALFVNTGTKEIWVSPSDLAPLYNSSSLASRDVWPRFQGERSPQMLCCVTPYTRLQNLIECAARSGPKESETRDSLLGLFGLMVLPCQYSKSHWPAAWLGTEAFTLHRVDDSDTW